VVPLSMPESRVSALERRLGEISGGPEIRNPPGGILQVLSPIYGDMHGALADNLGRPVR
jgi:hypothetical protein